MTDSTGHDEMERGSGLPIEEVAAAANRLSAQDFVEQVGGAFLVRGFGGLDVPVGPAATVFELDVQPIINRAAPRLDQIFPIRRTGRAVGHLIAIGRTANNDVVIPDTSVSRFHAFLKEQQDGGFAIQDAGSTNGTKVGHAPVPKKGEGSAVDLKTGDAVCIGQVELTYYTAPELIERLRRR